MSNMLLLNLFQIQHQDNEDFSKEIQEFVNLRKTAVCDARTGFGTISCLKKYYCQLHFANNRFKCLQSMKKGPFDFPWLDLYDSSPVMFSRLGKSNSNFHPSIIFTKNLKFSHCS